MCLQAAELRLQASCVWALGDIALWRSDLDTARTRFEQARPLFEQVGDVSGQASCIQGLGDIARERSDYDTAEARYQQAQQLYEQAGYALGQANCIWGLGEIARARSDNDAARAHYEEALALYMRIRDPYSIGLAHRALARVARTDGERARHAEAARAASTSIGRTDVVDSLAREFGDN